MNVGVGVAGRVVLAGGAIGFVSGGVVSRLMMALLARMNPSAAGTTSDDGFVMGQFTLAGSLNLALVGIAFGVLSAVLYLALEPLLVGPEWFRTISLSVGAGAVVATQLVHSDGVDFHVLDPYWFAILLFVILPVLHIAALDRVVRRIRAARGVPARAAAPLLGWVLRGALAVCFVVAVASLLGDVGALSEFNA